MAKHNISLVGADIFKKKLKEKATLSDVKQVVKINTAELQRKLAQDAPIDTGYLKRSIVFLLADAGLTGRVLIYAEYAPYLIFGTRFMAKQDFVVSNFNKQKERFKSDMNRLVK
ncbi:HK97-gp10 family putative phage morphogenesis protein [Enterococcus sp. AZ126]|uniref:HK97-gp10 family putative phage morphogenesis protein n=1 Tax=Enterococcus sp. AZ126 TaxID=2774635 RepID=UPI003F2880CC